MVQRAVSNSSGQQPNSYINLFHVAQYNLTLWILEENTSYFQQVTTQYQQDACQPIHFL